MTLFDYCIIYNGVHRKAEGAGFVAGKEPKVLKRDSILAKDEGQARTKVAREIPDDYMEAFDAGLVSVVLRPF